MKTIRIDPLLKPIQKKIILPGSLSISIRALIIASLIKGKVKLVNPLKSDDTYALVKALKVLGVDIKGGRNHFNVLGSIEDVKEKDYELNINLSGRSARMLLGLLCIVPGRKILTCAKEFKKRPIKDLVDALNSLGADIRYLEKKGHLPLQINSSTLYPGKVKMNGRISSQYFSTIMLIAPMVGSIEIDVLGTQVSKSFIDITINIMKKFGVEVLNKRYKQYVVENGQHYQNPGPLLIEPDATSASYFFAIAALTKSSIRILHLSPNSAQGDVRFVDILEKMGCVVIKNNEKKWIEVKGTDTLKAIEENMIDNPDIVQTLAIVAAFAKGKTRLRGIEHLKLKETDRITAVKKELSKMGIKVSASKDSLTIIGGNPKGVSIETYGDHRMAMAFAVVGTKIKNMVIKNPEVVSKSFPSFWKELGGITKIYEH